MSRAGFAAPTLLLSHLFGEIAQFARKVARAITNRWAVRSLRHYDDRMLKDIGLVRSDITAALDAPLYEDPSQHLRRVSAGRGRI